MSQIILDLFFSLIFILFLVLIIKIKIRTFGENRQSYRYIFSGLSVLLIVSMIRLLNGQNLFPASSVISDFFYLDLIEVTGIVTGITLLLAGVAVWIPGRKRDAAIDGEKPDFHEEVRHIQREILDTGNINALFDTVPEMICGTFGFIAAAVFRYSHVGNGMICTDRFQVGERVSRGPAPVDNGGRFAVDDIDNLQQRFQADYGMTIKLSDRTGAVILFWLEQPRHLAAETYSLLDHFGRLISLKLEMRLQSLKLTYYNDNRRLVKLLEKTVAGDNPFEVGFRKIQRVFRAALGIEYLSLAIREKGVNNIRRFTAGINSTILLESGGHPDLTTSPFRSVFETGRSLLIDDTTEEGLEWGDDLVQSCGQKSILMIPIISRNRVLAVLQLGHSRDRYFRSIDQVRAREMAGVLSRFVENDISRRAINKRETYLASLAALDNNLTNAADTRSLFDTAADILLQNIDTTAVRITRFDHKQGRLMTEAFCSKRSFNDINLEPVPISDKDTNCHYRVINDRHSLTVDQNREDAAMSENESARLVFAGVKTAVLVPIVVNSLCLGVISLGEMRRRERFTYDAAMIMFCREVATKLATGIKINMLGRAVIRDTEKNRIPRELFPERHIIREMKSPVTNLRGSLDLLKLQKFGRRGLPQRIIKTLNESTDQLVSIINKESN